MVTGQRATRSFLCWVSPCPPITGYLLEFQVPPPYLGNHCLWGKVKFRLGYSLVIARPRNPHLVLEGAGSVQSPVRKADSGLTKAPETGNDDGALPGPLGTGTRPPGELGGRFHSACSTLGPLPGVTSYAAARVAGRGKRGSFASAGFLTSDLSTVP